MLRIIFPCWPSLRFDRGIEFYGVRRQSEAATALWIAFIGHIQSGVALRLPPHSIETTNSAY